jgi:hypothetical protein
MTSSQPLDTKKCTYRNTLLLESMSVLRHPEVHLDESAMTTMCIAP